MTGDPMVDILLVLLLIVGVTCVVHWGRALRTGWSRRDSRPAPSAGASRGGQIAHAAGGTELPDSLMWAPGLPLMSDQRARRSLAVPEVYEDLEDHGWVAVALVNDCEHFNDCEHSGLVGPQVHVTGGNLVTYPAYGMDPLTGCWGINAFPRRTQPGRR